MDAATLGRPSRTRAPDRMNRASFLSDDCPPMGIYETLYAFRESFGQFMGAPGTHPWSQGFPLTTQLEGGPELPSSVGVTWEDRFYPKAWGHPRAARGDLRALQRLLRFEASRPRT